MAALTVPLPARVEAAVRGDGPAREAAVDEAVRILKSRDSLWPVATGRSKRAFRRSGRGGQSRVYNPLGYSSYVEEQQNRPAARTLARFEARLLRAARGRRTMTREQREQEHRATLASAAARRVAIADEAGLYREYFRNFIRSGYRRGARIPRTLTELRREVLRRAGRESERL